MELLRQGFSFGKIGILATLSHLMLCWLLTTYAELPIYLANLAGAAAAFSISFCGNAAFTFRVRESLWQCAVRYFFVTLVSLAMTSGILAFVEENGLPFQYYAMIVLVTVPPTTFLLAKLWAFRIRNR